MSSWDIRGLGELAWYCRNLHLGIIDERFSKGVTRNYSLETHKIHS